eukprot:1183793-Prorocentrum_minimum.AAC.3
MRSACVEHEQQKKLDGKHVTVDVTPDGQRSVHTNDNPGVESSRRGDAVVETEKGAFFVTPEVSEAGVLTRCVKLPPRGVDPVCEAPHRGVDPVCEARPQGCRPGV